MGEQDKGPYQAAWVYKDKKLAGEYDYTRYHKTKRRRRRDLATQAAILEALGRLENCKELLDLPCGTGRLSKLLMDAGFAYTGSDISGEMIEVARGKFDNPDDVRFVEANGEDLPFADNAFDCVVCVRFLGRIPPGPRLRILKQLNRVSRRYLLVAAGYFGRPRPCREGLFTSLPWLFRSGAKRAKRHVILREELDQAGWQLDFWLPYKSCGFFSSTKTIGVYTKKDPQPVDEA